MNVSPNQPAGDGAPLEGVTPPATEKTTVVLSPGQLPAGGPYKPGDRLTFVVTAQSDEQGGVSGYFESNIGEEEQWEKEARALAATPPEPPEET